MLLSLKTFYANIHEYNFTFQLTFPLLTRSEIKVQKLSLGRFVPKGSILVNLRYILVLKVYKGPAPGTTFVPLFLRVQG